MNIYIMVTSDGPCIFFEILKWENSPYTTFLAQKIEYVYTYVLCNPINNFYVSLHKCVTHQGFDFIPYHDQRRSYVMIQF